MKIEAPELRVDAESLLGGVNWRAVFGSEGPVEVEIGVGKGRFLLAAAGARPDVLHFGVEWANQYLRIAERRALRQGLTNVRFARVDARELLGAVASASVRAYYIFYPDPWPKKRHHKRRLLQLTTAEQLARSLAPGGALHVATDHADYWETIEPLFDAHPAFTRRALFGGEGFPLPVDGPLTNFEAKYGLEGRMRHRASWERRDTCVVRSGG